LPEQLATDLHRADPYTGCKQVGGPCDQCEITETRRRFRRGFDRRVELKGLPVPKNRFVSAILLAATSLCAVSGASAQKPTAEQQPGLGGPVIAGVCLLSREAVLANSKVGIAAAARLKQLADESQAEIDLDRAPIDAEARALRAEGAKLPDQQRRAREKALADKFAPVQTKAELRTREIEKTRAKAMEMIASEAQPVIASAYKDRNCGLLLDRTNVLGGNLANDLTVAVVQGLDAKITTINVQRETVAPAPAPAATPAR